MLSRFADLLRLVMEDAGKAEQVFIGDYLGSIDSFTASFRSSQTGYRLPFLRDRLCSATASTASQAWIDAVTMLQVLAVEAVADRRVGRLPVLRLHGIRLHRPPRSRPALQSSRPRHRPLLPGHQPVTGMGSSSSTLPLMASFSIQQADWGGTEQWAFPTTFEDGIFGRGSMSGLEDPLKSVVTTLRQRALIREGEVDVIPLGNIRRGWGTEVVKGGVKLDIAAVKDILTPSSERNTRTSRVWRELAQAWSPICDRAAVLGDRIDGSRVSHRVVGAAEDDQRPNLQVLKQVGQPAHTRRQR